jgi:CheY-like chemotaxis protein
VAYALQGGVTPRVVQTKFWTGLAKSSKLPCFCDPRSGTNPVFSADIEEMTSMLTNEFVDRLNAAGAPAPRASVQNVVIVNGNTEAVRLLESVLDGGRYDVVFVESSSHAYSQIKRVRPHLVILCVRMDDAEALQVLSMLKLDQETRDIPVITYASEREPHQFEFEGMEEPSDVEMFTPKPAVWMN